MFEGFTSEMIELPEVTIHVRHGGSGPPLLLCHGYPQTGAMWHKVAPALAAHFTVVVADTRGYGASSAPPSDAEHAAYSKRTMANDMVGVMAHLGHERFRLAGHDRGGRVSYRLALDHPQRVERLALLDIMTTLDTWERMNWRSAIGAYHWQFLAQPDGLPETLIGANKPYFLRETLRRLAGDPDAFSAEALAEYERSFDDDMVRAICEDYRAGASFDRDLDEASREEGRKIRCPVLVLYGAGRGNRPPELFREAWAPWVAGALDVKGLRCGHFLPEEAPEETARELLGFFASEETG